MKFLTTVAFLATGAAAFNSFAPKKAAPAKISAPVSNTMGFIKWDS